MLLLFSIFETEFHYVALDDLKLTLPARLVLNPQSAACLCLLNEKMRLKPSVAWTRMDLILALRRQRQAGLREFKANLGYMMRADSENKCVTTLGDLFVGVRELIEKTIF